MSFQLYLDKILTRTPKSLTFTCMTKTERIDGAKFFIFNNQNFKHEFIFFMEHVRGTASVHENTGFHMNMISPYKSETPEYALRKKCPYSELFWSVFPRSRTD